ncbi:hypothetical protein COU49_01155 [Candidatus Nomurabacteria bacterium CG10_big_fil_rev_8_21_14_0_10_35_16]|uniref:histidine kinase n=1 Tax=Candidatus Nomurabacteria bacterium CG10_big_fil_rev_8_21_14_0_10_35_16 TaxID=1974731 RepID=A0A2H0TDT6_9BACT|nr:MAG: hypothetical protein COU49_01155 [Candidatus Nomurabacteria bacterium CG10_big_fil_rev_8_21_14_0_10_35_16]
MSSISFWKYTKFNKVNIKTKLKALIIIICIIYLIIGLTIYLLFHNHQQSLQKSSIAQDIVLRILEKRFLADEYISTYSERAKLQWILKQGDLKKRLVDVNIIFNGSIEKDLFFVINDSVVASDYLFSQIVQNHENNLSYASSDIVLQKQLRLASQLLVNVQKSTSAATKLADINREIVAESFQKIFFIFLFFSVFLFLTLIITFRVIWNSASELHKAKAEDEAILNGIGDGVVAIDLLWNIILFNKAASDMSGWSREDAMGKSFRDVIKFIRESDRKENIKFIKEAMILGKVNMMENHTLLIRKDKSEMPVGDSASPIFNENGQVVGVVIIFRDVSKEQEAFRLKSDFAYASHQFRTPVTKALWGLEIALEDKGNSQKKNEHLMDAYISLKSINELSNHLLEISEIDQQRIIKKLNNIEITTLVNKVLKSLQDRIKRKNITIIIKPANYSLKIKTDPKLLEKALFEVLENAIGYNKKDGEVSVEYIPQKGGILIQIKDSGIGITNEQEQLIFTKFFRGSNIPEESIGAGLGLYIAREYIKILGGRIWFKSQEGTGTTFSIFLPNNS